MVTIVLHFLCDHFIRSVSKLHSSQHSTEDFKRSFVHSCITKSKLKSIFGFKSSLSSSKKKYPSYRTLNFKSLNLVIYTRQDEATARVLQTKNLDGKLCSFNYASTAETANLTSCVCSHTSMKGHTPAAYYGKKL